MDSSSFFRYSYVYLTVDSLTDKIGQTALKFDEQVNSTTKYLSSALSRMQLVKITDLKTHLDQSQLETLYINVVDLTTAILECLTVAVELTTSKRKGKP